MTSPLFSRVISVGAGSGTWSAKRGRTKARGGMGSSTEMIATSNTRVPVYPAAGHARARTRSREVDQRFHGTSGSREPRQSIPRFAQGRAESPPRRALEHRGEVNQDARLRVAPIVDVIVELQSAIRDAEKDAPVHMPKAGASRGVVQEDVIPGRDKEWHPIDEHDTGVLGDGRHAMQRHAMRLVEGH